MVEQYRKVISPSLQLLDVIQIKEQMKDLNVRTFPEINMKLICLMIAVFMTTYSYGQSNNKSIEVYYSPLNVSLNSDELEYNPFGEYGSRYLGSNEVGINLNYYASNRVSFGAGIAQFKYNLQSFSFNPFFDFENLDEVRRTDSQSKVTALKFHLYGQYKLVTSDKVNLFVSAGVFAYTPSSISTETIAETGRGLSTSTGSGKINEAWNIGKVVGLRVEYSLSEHILLSLHPQVSSALVIIRFTGSHHAPLEAIKKELSLPIGLVCKW